MTFVSGVHAKIESTHAQEKRIPTSCQCHHSVSQNLRRKQLQSGHNLSQWQIDISLARLVTWLRLTQSWIAKLRKPHFSFQGKRVFEVLNSTLLQAVSNSVFENVPPYGHWFHHQNWKKWNALPFVLLLLSRLFCDFRTLWVPQATRKLTPAFFSVSVVWSQRDNCHGQSKNKSYLVRSVCTRGFHHL